MEKVDSDNFFFFQNAKTQDHTMKLLRGGGRTDKRKDCFTQRIIYLWNLLPQNVVPATCIDGLN